MFFSRAAVKILGSIFRDFKINHSSQHHNQCVDAANVGGEEILTAVCLKKKFNVTAYHVLDEAGNELISVGPISEVLTWVKGKGKRGWYWSKKPVTNPKTGQKMHQVSVQIQNLFDELEIKNKLTSVCCFYSAVETSQLHFMVTKIHSGCTRLKMICICNLTNCSWKT